jgi:hypothetical protein
MPYLLFGCELIGNHMDTANSDETPEAFIWVNIDSIVPNECAPARKRYI